jgi:phosphatidylglycerophosphate synthase
LLNLRRFQIEREKVFNIPNTLTISRIIITPIIGYHIVSLNFITASVLLITAGITEYPYFNITVF